MKCSLPRLVSTLGVVTLLSPLASAASLDQMQQAYVNQKFGMFLHYNMGTFTNEDWAHSLRPVNTFTPTGSIKQATDQWAAAAKAAGMRYGILTAKHHDGFALWNTNQSTYDIGATNWYNDSSNVNYQTDIMQAYADSFRAQNLGVGIYYSIWDKSNGIGSRQYADDPVVTLKNSAQATAHVKAELTHLLTAYGPVRVLFTDGWGGWRTDTSYTFINYDEIYTLIKTLSPSTILVENNTLEAMDHTDIPSFEYPTRGRIPPVGNTMPSEVSDCIRSDNQWFYKSWNVSNLKSASYAGDMVRTANSRTAAYLYDVPPSTTGFFPSSTVQRLADIGANLGEFNSVLTNGSFEVATADPIATNSYNLNVMSLTGKGDADTLGNWTLDGNSAWEWAWYCGSAGLSGHDGLGTAQEGQRFLNLTQNTGGQYLEQSFHVEAGQTYRVQYYERARDNDAASQLAQIFLETGSASGVLSQIANASTVGWQLFTFEFTPTMDTLATLRFTAGADGAAGVNGTLMDHVDVLMVAPEPASITLLGLAGSMLMLRRQKEPRTK